MAQRDYTDDSLAGYGKMLNVYNNLLTDEEKQLLNQWEETLTEGGARFATSDWPGWEKHIGPPPCK